MAKKTANAAESVNNTDNELHSVPENPTTNQVQHAQEWLDNQPPAFKKLYENKEEKNNEALLSFMAFIKSKEKDRGFRIFVEDGLTLEQIAEIDSGSSMPHLENERWYSTYS